MREQRSNLDNAHLHSGTRLVDIILLVMRSVNHQFCGRGASLRAWWRTNRTDEPISRVAIIGAGQMVPTIAVATTLAGRPTTLIGRTAGFKASKQERRRIRRRPRGVAVCYEMNEGQAAAALGRLPPVDTAWFFGVCRERLTNAGDDA